MIIIIIINNFSVLPESTVANYCIKGLLMQMLKMKNYNVTL